MLTALHALSHLILREPHDVWMLLLVPFLQIRELRLRKVKEPGGQATAQGRAEGQAPFSPGFV